MNYKDEAEIDLIDLFHQILLKWRLILIFMFLGMMVFGIIGYNKKVPVVIDEKGEIVAPAEETSLVALGSKLSSNEKNEVVLAIESYLRYEKIYNDWIKRGDESIALKYDALHVPGFSYTYKISDYNDDNVPLQSTVTNVDNIIALYKKALFDGSVIAEINNANNWNYTDGFVRELYGVDKNGLDIMYIWLNAPSKEEGEKVMQVLDKTINSSYAEIQKQYDHKLSRIFTSSYETFNSGILDQQKSQNDTLIGIEKSMQQVSSAMPSDQKAYYTALLNAVKEAEETGDTVDPMEIVKREAKYESGYLEETADAASSVLEKTSDGEKNVVMVSSNNIDIKVIILGAFTGIIIALFLFGILYIVSPTLKTQRDMESMFKLSVLGKIVDDRRYKKAFGGIDRFIDSQFEKKEGDFSVKERFNMITALIDLGMNKENYKSVYFTGAVCDDCSDTFKERLMEELKKKSGNCNGLSVLCGTSPLISTESLELLSKIEAVIIVEKIGVSRYEDIARIVGMCDRFGTRILGAVILV